MALPFQTFPHSSTPFRDLYSCVFLLPSPSQHTQPSQKKLSQNRQYYEQLDLLAAAHSSHGDGGSETGTGAALLEAGRLRQYRTACEAFPPDVRRAALCCLWFPGLRRLAADEDEVYLSPGGGWVGGFVCVCVLCRV
jgi:hypothetical protein